MSLNPITPFYAAKVANIRLSAEGVDKVVTPQMLYTYHKKGTIASAEVVGSDKKYFDGDAFKTWLDAYVSGGATSTRTDVNKLAEQYM